MLSGSNGDVSRTERAGKIIAACSVLTKDLEIFIAA
jgi:hypothetical protein